MSEPYPDTTGMIDGQPRGGSKKIDILNPATSEVIGQVAVNDTSDARDAMQVAAMAFSGWAAMPPIDRGRILRATAAGLPSDAERIGRILTLEQGKPLAEAEAEVRISADVLDWQAEEGRRHYGRVITSPISGLRQTVLRRPRGPAVLLTPWNFPLLLLTQKVAAALSAGCSVVAKPSEETPASAFALFDALARAGLPHGVANVLFGDPASLSQALIQAPEAAKVSLTGSIPVGRIVGRLAAEALVPATLELGGHAPVIISADANVERAAALLAPYKFRNAGQACIAPTRFLIDRTVFDRFVNAFIAEAGKIHVGNGADSQTTMGPLLNQRRVDAVQELVDDARTCGADIQGVASCPDGPGCFMAPTVALGVPERARAMREEPFGPLALMTPVDDLSEALRIANAVPHGLAGFVFARKADTIRRLSERLEVGMVAVNHTTISTPETPFGGTGASGYGSEGGIEGPQGYTRPVTVSDALSDPDSEA